MIYTNIRKLEACTLMIHTSGFNFYIILILIFFKISFTLSNFSSKKQTNKLISEVKNLSFFDCKSKFHIVMLSHIKSIKLVNGFYCSLYTYHWRIIKPIFLGIYLKNYTYRDFLLNVINFKCINFTREALILLSVCDISIFINVTVICSINTLFFSLLTK